MGNIYVSLQEAAELEEKKYTTFRSFFYRNKEKFEVKVGTSKKNTTEYLISVASLSLEAQERYRQNIEPVVSDVEVVEGGEIMKDGVDVNEVPWYVHCDFESFYVREKKQYNEAIALAKGIDEYLDDKANKELLDVNLVAKELGFSSTRSFYRYVDYYSTALDWAKRIEGNTGLDYSYFRILALCRKPRVIEAFPSILDEVKQDICNIWFNPDFAQNQGSVEMLYTALVQLEMKKGLNVPSYRTISRFINYLMKDPTNESARFLAANGVIEWRNKKMLKGKRDNTSTQVMEVIHGDGHTFDCWVSYTHPNGKVTAVKPTLVAWLDTRSRVVVGDVVCLNSNSQVIKESILKCIYGSPGGVPRAILIDNGKDFTSNENIGQDRYIRQMINAPDEELQGFYGSVGIEMWHRAQVKQPWVKNVERFFSTVCNQFTKWFNSYTGTLTGSKTSGKINKDVNKMVERGELLTMEEFYEKWTEFKDNYHNKAHSGIKKENDRWSTPMEVFLNCEDRYVKAVPPKELAAIMLMKRDIASVSSQGIRKFGTLYSSYELAQYANKKVVVRYDPSDLSKIYVYEVDTEKLICEAEPYEALAYFPTEEREIERLQDHLRNQKRQYRTTKNRAMDMLTPYEQLAMQEDRRVVVGKVDLMIGKQRNVAKIVQLPKDKVYRNNREEQREESEYLLNAGRLAAERMMKQKTGGY